MIQEFIAFAKSGGMAPSNRYEVLIPFSDTMTQKAVSLFCDQISLPGMNIESAPARSFGETREMPYNHIFDPVSMSLYCDANFNIKFAFENWMNQIIDKRTRTLSYYSNYVKDVMIVALDKTEQELKYGVILHEAYPKIMQPIQLDTSSKEIMKINLTLQYKWWSYSNDY